MLRKSIGLHVVLVKATHTIHFIMDTAGNVLNILHMGSVAVGESNTQGKKKKSIIRAIIYI